MALDRERADIVHCGAAEAAVADPKSRRFDDRGVDAEACAGAHHRASILGDVRLEQGEQEGSGRLRHIARESKRLWEKPAFGETPLPDTEKRSIRLLM